MLSALYYSEGCLLNYNFSFLKFTRSFSCTNNLLMFVLELTCRILGLALTIVEVNAGSDHKIFSR